LRIRRDRIVGIFLDHRLISRHRQIRRTLFFGGEPDIELRACSVFAVRSGPHDRRENFHRALA
jgi:hypothetical protein